MVMLAGGSLSFPIWLFATLFSAIFAAMLLINFAAPGEEDIPLRYQFGLILLAVALASYSRGAVGPQLAEYPTLVQFFRMMQLSILVMGFLLALLRLGFRLRTNHS